MECRKRRRERDGTITDDGTLLMWEKKDDSGEVHDENARYKWWISIVEFLGALNNTCEGEGVVRCDSDDLCGVGGQCGFAGYRDWRMPNVKELLSIANYRNRNPVVSSGVKVDCVSSRSLEQCSCTEPGLYRSPTSCEFYGPSAWYVSFSSGLVGANSENLQDHVRAVRDGS